MLLEKSGVRELSWVLIAPSLDAMLGCETEVTCGVVKEMAETEL